MDNVLRVTEVESKANRLEIFLEGRVSGPWVAELQKLCEVALRRRCKVTLEFSGVSFIDAQGISLIRSLLAKEVSVENCTPFVAGQLAKEMSEGA